ncbi:MAG: WecB/TagA/CpsF family glycosyltransferase [Vampirovibrio sp.]|nr:WecB/TagA/CpsF family glycosyltransferase [Vampirovibrio sp.]
MSVPNPQQSHAVVQPPLKPLETLTKRRVLDVNVTNASFDAVLETVVNWGRLHRSSYVCISAVHLLVESHHNKALRELVNNADIVTPDGRPVSLLMNLLYGTRQEQVAGPDLMPELFRRAEEEGLKVAFFGCTPEVLQKLEGVIQQKHPNLDVTTYIPHPHRPMSDAEDQAVVDQVNASGANILFVAIGCPLQEQWIAAQVGKVNAVMLGVGAAVPFFSGDKRRCPKWVQAICLEWLWRLLEEPKRLFKRYFVTNTQFLALGLRQFLNLRFRG